MASTSTQVISLQFTQLSFLQSVHYLDHHKYPLHWSPLFDSISIFLEAVGLSGTPSDACGQNKPIIIQNKPIVIWEKGASYC